MLYVPYLSLRTSKFAYLFNLTFGTWNDTSGQDIYVNLRSSLCNWIKFNLITWTAIFNTKCQYYKFTISEVKKTCLKTQRYHTGKVWNMKSRLFHLFVFLIFSSCRNSKANQSMTFLFCSIRMLSEKCTWNTWPKNDDLSAVLVSLRSAKCESVLRQLCDSEIIIDELKIILVSYSP